MTAKIICIEGPDRLGKATQSKMLLNELWYREYGADRVEVPWDDKITHKLIYHMLGNGLAKRYPTTFQLVQLANKLLFQMFYLPMLMMFDDYVILDRWNLSSIVYGRASGVPTWLEKLSNFLLIKPDVTIVLVGEPFVKSGGDVYEADNEFQAKVRYEYETWANQHSDRAILIKIDEYSNKIDTNNIVIGALEKRSVI